MVIAGSSFVFTHTQETNTPGGVLNRTNYMAGTPYEGVFSQSLLTTPPLPFFNRSNINVRYTNSPYEWPPQAGAAAAAAQGVFHQPPPGILSPPPLSQTHSVKINPDSPILPPLPSPSKTPDPDQSYASSMPSLTPFNYPARFDQGESQDDSAMAAAEPSSVKVEPVDTNQQRRSERKRKPKVEDDYESLSGIEEDSDSSYAPTEVSKKIKCEEGAKATARVSRTTLKSNSSVSPNSLVSLSAASAASLPSPLARKTVLRRNNTDPSGSVTAQAARRLQQNREAASKSRIRKKIELQSYKNKTEQLTKENAALKAQLNQVKSENSILRHRLSHYEEV